MSTTTARIALYKPAADGSENVNVVTDINNNMDNIDGKIGARPVTSGTMPGAPAYDGELVHQTDTDDLYFGTGGAWLKVLLLEDLTTPNSRLTALEGDHSAVVLSADEATGASDTTLSDSGLTRPVAANTKYIYEILAGFHAPTGADFKYDLTFPAGATLRQFAQAAGFAQATDITLPGDSPTPYSAFLGDGTGNVVASAGGNHNVLSLRGSLRVAGTAGNLTFRFAQNTADATPTTLQDGSYMRIERAD